MGMTIDDTLTGLYALREFLKHSEFEGLEEQTKVQIQIVTDAIDTMRKYQKIQEIVQSKTTRVSYDIGFRQIKKVVKDATN